MAAKNPLNPHLPLLIFERSAEGRHGTQVTSGLRKKEGAPSLRLPAGLAAGAPPALPMVDELTLTRHYVELSQKTFGIDTGFYPLGSCTMKYNPKSLERLARGVRVALVHPAQRADSVPGFLRVLHELQSWLAEISGFDAVSLQPAAGAQGEFAGMLIFRRYFEDRGETARRVMLVPDSAHGTNPASAVLANFEVHEIKCAPAGGVMTPELLEAAIAQYGADEIAGIMLTNPGTLGAFETNILHVSRRLKEIGALLYYDGANLNALVGLARPGDMGFDLMHYNTHKTFSTPHGGGGPGSGPIGVKAHLAPYLPHPQVRKISGAGVPASHPDAGRDARATGDTYEGDTYEFFTPPRSIGRLKMWHGQWSMLLRCWGYILLHGPDGLRENTEAAILSANYLQARLKDALGVPYSVEPDGSPRYCMHEFVASAAELKREHGVKGMELAKALLNRGFHAPTMYFPLIVEEAMMVEPTESESQETLDAFADTLLAIIAAAKADPQSIRRLENLEVTHLDEPWAARNLDVRWQPGDKSEQSAGG